MRIEILTFEGCPNAEAAHGLVLDAVAMEAVEAHIEVIDVATAEFAKRVHFLGSPSVRIDGEDVEPEANDRVDYGLMCRTYRDANGSSGTPSLAMILAALRRRRTG